MIIIIAGVSGCGKTTVGTKVAERLKIDYFEADDFHPQSNIDKMAAGHPLNDHDRMPWLKAINRKIKSCQGQNMSAVFTCSALKEMYRDLIEENLSAPVSWFFLQGSFETITERMKSRTDHFFKPEMLQSQFDALEAPARGIIINMETALDEQVNQICKLYKKSSHFSG